MREPKVRRVRANGKLVYKFICPRCDNVFEISRLQMHGMDWVKCSCSYARIDNLRRYCPELDFEPEQQDK